MWWMPSASGVVKVNVYRPGNPAPTGVAKPTGVWELLPSKMATRKPGVVALGLNGIGITPAGGLSGTPLPGRSFRKMPSLRRKKMVGVLTLVTSSNSDRPLSLLGALGGRSPVLSKLATAVAPAPPPPTSVIVGAEV